MVPMDRLLCRVRVWKDSSGRAVFKCVMDGKQAAFSTDHHGRGNIIIPYRAVSTVPCNDRNAEPLSDGKQQKQIIKIQEGILLSLDIASIKRHQI